MLKRLNKWLNPLANPDTASGLDKVLGSFSLHNAQLYVGFVNPDGEPPKAVCHVVESSYSDEGGGIGGFFLFDRNDADRLVRFLESVLENELPASFEFPSPLGPLSGSANQVWSVQSFESEWHHGGGFKGKIGSRGGFIITKRSAQRLITYASKLFSASPEV